VVQCNSHAISVLASLNILQCVHNLSLFCRFDQVGIYVVMFLEILQTLIKVLIVFSILIIAFGLAFYILLSRVSSEVQYFLSINKVILKGPGTMLFRVAMEIQPLLYQRGQESLSYFNVCYSDVPFKEIFK
jgi:Ion transport protein.